MSGGADRPPEGYLGADARIGKGPAPEMVEAGYRLEMADAVFFVLGRGESDPFRYFYALYAGVTIVWCISTALLFLDIFFAERAAPRRFEEARRVDRWVLNLSGAVGFIANILAVLFIFVGSWYPAGFPTLAEWNWWMRGITAFSVISGIVIWFVSQSARRGKSDEQLIEEGLADREISEGSAPA